MEAVTSTGTARFYKGYRPYGWGVFQGTVERYACTTAIDFGKNNGQWIFLLKNGQLGRIN
jgi:hypothetical protein